MGKINKDTLFLYLESLHKDAKCALNYTNDYELLISIILSAQTTDKAVNKVTIELFKKYPTFKDLSTANIEDVESIIRQLGLYKNKAKNIISASRRLVDLECDRVPKDFDTLIMLDGVGRKTANVFLAEYYNENTLGVDTHILRVSKRLKILSEKDDAYEAEKKLIKFFKGYNLKHVHHLLIAFGRNECDARKPQCENCQIKEYCKYQK